MKSVLKCIAENDTKKLGKLLRKRTIEDASEPLLEAARLGREECISPLLAIGGPPNCRNEEGKTPLYLLLEQGGGKPSAIRPLIEAGCSVNRAVPDTQLAPLHVAARKGYQVAVRVILGGGAQVDKKDVNGYTALMLAAREGRHTIVRMLLNAGAHPNKRNLLDETALHLASRYGHVDCAEELLKHYGDPNIRDVRGQTPILVACKHDKGTMMKLLLEYHCDLNAHDTLTGRTVLHYAVKSGNIFLVNTLLSEGADPNVRDKSWQTPFMLALSTGRRDLLQLLIGAGSDVTTTDINGNTALHLAAKDGNAKLVTLLLDSRVNINIKGDGGITALMMAAYGGFANVVHVLLKYGANPNLTDRNRASALMYAIMSDASLMEVHSIVKALIRSSCNLDQRCNVQNLMKKLGYSLPEGHLQDGMFSPLEMAMHRGKSAVFMMLVKAGCDISDFDGDKAQLDNEFNSLGTDLRMKWYLMKCLQREKLRVKSLKELCRCPLRQNLRKYRMENQIGRLPLSDHLKRYLTFSELEEIELNFSITFRDRQRSDTTISDGSTRHLGNGITYTLARAKENVASEGDSGNSDEGRSFVVKKSTRPAHERWEHQIDRRVTSRETSQDPSEESMRDTLNRNMATAEDLEDDEIMGLTLNPPIIKVCDTDLKRNTLARRSYNVGGSRAPSEYHRNGSRTPHELKRTVSRISEDRNGHGRVNRSSTPKSVTNQFDKLQNGTTDYLKQSKRGLTSDTGSFRRNTPARRSVTACKSTDSGIYDQDRSPATSPVSRAFTPTFTSPPLTNRPTTPTPRPFSPTSMIPQPTYYSTKPEGGSRCTSPSLVERCDSPNTVTYLRPIPLSTRCKSPTLRDEKGFSPTPTKEKYNSNTVPRRPRCTSPTTRVTSPTQVVTSCLGPTTRASTSRERSKSPAPVASRCMSPPPAVGRCLSPSFGITNNGSNIYASLPRLGHRHGQKKHVVIMPAPTKTSLLRSNSVRKW